MSMVTFKKPSEHVALPDWYLRTLEMREIADARQSDSLSLRAEGRQLRNETAITTKWDTYRNDGRLHDRYAENCCIHINMCPVTFSLWVIAESVLSQ